MNIFVIGCGRWGSLITWYLDRIGHHVTLYGRKSSPKMQAFLATRQNDLLTLPSSVALTTELNDIESAETVIISVGSQSLRSLLHEPPLQALRNKTVVLCMKGLEMDTGKRLSQIAAECLDPSNAVAVWLGPGHVQEFYRGIPNCMVIDSEREDVKRRLVQSFSSDLIRFYYGGDMIGNEVGAAAKNVVGIAAGFLDGVEMSSLKGALMSRGTREVARLIKAMGGTPRQFMGDARYFRHMYVWSGIWQQMGWNSIIYLAVLTAIDPGLHEAAMIDGASKLRRIWHIDLPGISGTGSTAPKSGHTAQGQKDCPMMGRSLHGTVPYR